MTPVKKFDFEDYAKQQFEEIKAILKGFSSTYMPREEIMLIHDSTMGAIKTVSTTVDKHTEIIDGLQRANELSKGAKMNRREMLAWLIALVSIIGAAWWVPSLLHK